MAVLILVFILLVVVIAGSSYGIVLFNRADKPASVLVAETITMGLLVSSWFVFLIMRTQFSADYNQAIDNIDEGYTPLANDHVLSIVILLILGTIGAYKVWSRGRAMPPLALVFYTTMLSVSSIICVFIVLQMSERTEQVLHMYQSDVLYFMAAPTLHALIGILLIVKLLREEAVVAVNRNYNNQILDSLNSKLAKTNNYGLWIIFAALPMLLGVYAVLLLFGQSPDALVKVFTETTTWKFSAETHPPYLDHQGHYLCTVAACGDPKIVKPKRLGTRHGNTIIVNRQLMIANAFEELIQEKFGKGHAWIRRNYDTYGYPLSKKITTSFWSNTTYLLMKPLEWFFLLVLYTFCIEPEKKIQAQYALEN
ncbi:MAG: hypothetical protein QNK23_08125 [Crocinitomicaceae bacterium]|nr:hypothetical protein [Crocinitomicaceae bacterium]